MLKSAKDQQLDQKMTWIFEYICGTTKERVPRPGMLKMGFFLALLRGLISEQPIPLGNAVRIHLVNESLVFFVNEFSSHFEGGS